MSSTPAESESLLSPRKMLIQIVGWLIGIGLLFWVVKGAAAKGDWSRITNADPWLVAALVGCTAASAVFNGTAFWITIQPVRRVRWLDMQWLNLVSNMLNYAPVRLGAVARIGYNLRVDKLNLFQIGAWFGMIAYLLFLGIGACLLATLVHDRVDWIWFALALGQIVVGVGLARIVASMPLVVRYGRGIDQMFMHKRGLWGAACLRVLDLAAYTGRMAAALAILGHPLAASHVVVLAMVALAASLMPVGKVGFREFCVAAAAARMNMQFNVDAGTWAQLALVESAGEAIFFIPLGAVALLWYRKQWAQSKRESPMQVPAAAR